jgi:hypothetical protein
MLNVISPLQLHKVKRGSTPIETKRKRDKEKERKLLVAPREFQQLKPGGRWRGLRTSGPQVLNCVLSNFCHLAWHLNLDWAPMDRVEILPKTWF